MTTDLAFTEDEAQAMRLAVTVALEEGLATEGLDTEWPTNSSMVSLGRKLGCEIPEWCSEDV